MVKRVDVPEEMTEDEALSLLDQMPPNSTVADEARARWSEVRSMNDQIAAPAGGGKYAHVEPRNQIMTIVHETAPLCRVISGDQWEAIARAENGKYWRIVEQEKGT